jgi:hypothetical protein
MHLRRCGLRVSRLLQYAYSMFRVFRPFLILCLALALLAQGTASACLQAGKGLPSVGLPPVVGEVVAHSNCHTDLSDQVDTTCSACAACCLGALLQATTSPQASTLSGSVHSLETPQFWQSFLAEHLDPPPRQHQSLV